MTSQTETPDKPLTPTRAWQPLTPRGVAAFANATFGRLVLVQCVMATFVGATIVWFAVTQWFPVITTAIRHLPDEGVIEDGRLNTPLHAPMRLAGTRSFAIVIDPRGTGRAGRVADVELTVQQSQAAVCGMLGCWRFAYSPEYVISANRKELEPRWGAWRPLIAAAIGIIVVVHLLVAWWAVGLFTCPLVKLITFYGDRDISWAASWRVAQAALLPGAAVIAFAVALYAFGVIDPIRFAVFYGVHIVCGIVFLLTAPFFLEKTVRGASRKNPFATVGQSGRSKNPFASRQGD